MNGRDLAIIAALGLGAWVFLFRASPVVAAPIPAAAPPAPPGGGGFLDALGAGVGQGVGKLFSAAGEGIGTAVGDAAKGLNDPESQSRKGLRKAGDNLQELGSALTGGFIKSPSKRRAKKQAVHDKNEDFLLRMERWAAEAHALMARADTVEWVISASGSGRPAVDVYFQGQKAPFRLYVPDGAGTERLAWVAEPVARALGTFTQRGRRLGTPFVRYPIPAYSVANIYANPGLTLPARQASTLGETIDDARGIVQRATKLTKDQNKLQRAAAGDEQE